MSRCIMRSKSGCVGLELDECPPRCPFYKDSEGRQQSEQKAYNSIRSLPADKQQEIANKYYGGEMPWMEDHQA